MWIGLIVAISRAVIAISLELNNSRARLYITQRLAKPNRRVGKRIAMEFSSPNQKPMSLTKTV